MNECRNLHFSHLNRRFRPKFNSIMKKRNLKKLLVGDNVEVRHFGDGLEGSWHPAVVIAEKKSSRQVKHNELLCEDGTAKLVEWIAVSASVDGRLSSHRISKNHRGHIRPAPPLSITHGQKFSYGLCVDAFVVDSWWEGVVFDREEDSNHRLLFFPDLGDQQLININNLRITHDWDEITGDWRARGYWSLIVLLEKFEQEKGPLPVSIRQIWYDVRINSGFKSKISAWTWGKKYLWDKFVMEAIKENISAANGQAFPTTDFTAGAKITNRSRKRRKIEKDQNNLVMPIAHTDCSYNKEISKPIKSRDTSKEGYYSCPKACPAWKEKGSSQGAIYVNEGKESCLDGEIDVNRSEMVFRGKKSVKTKDKTLCVEDGGSRESKRKWQPVSQTFLLGAEYCPQAPSDYIVEIKNRNSIQKGLENRKLESGQLKLRFKEVELKAKMHLLAMGWRFEYFKERKILTTRYVSPKGKLYHTLSTACFALEKDQRGMVGSVINDLGGRGHHSNRGYVQNMVTFSPYSNSLALERTEDSIPRENFKLQERQVRSVIPISIAHNDSRNNGVSVKALPCEAKIYTVGTDGRLDSTIQESPLTEILHEQPNTEGRCSSHLTKRKASCVVVGMEQIEEEEYCPQAIMEYIRETRMQKLSYEAIRMLRSKVKKHLSALGWRFRTSKGNSSKVRYFSPEGKRFISLHQACQWMEERTANSATEKTSSNEISTEFRENAKISDGFLCDRSFGRVHARGTGQDWKKRKYITPLFTSPLHRQSEICFHPHHPDIVEKTKQDGLEVISLCGGKRRYEKTKQDGDEVLDLWDRKHQCALGCRKKKKRNAPHFLLKHYVKPDRSYQTRMLCQRKSAPLKGLTSGTGQHRARSILSWLIERDVVLPRQQVSYSHEKAGCVKAKGRITYEGIKCKCCDKVYSLANFEAHAGSTNRCPAAHIFLKDGRSLLDCQIQSLKDIGFVAPFTSQPCKRRKISYSQCKNDCICSVCHYGGTLVLCDYCPSSFHLSCIDLKELPEGKWFCPSCRCAICGQSGFNGDVDQFTDTTVLFCDQCEREYHVGCLKKRGLPRLDSCPQGDWFCSKKCAKIFRYLNRNVGRSKPMGVDGLSWTIVKSSSGLGKSDIEAVTEWHSKLCVALGLLHECFVPIVDHHTQSDIVADVLFNKRSELNRLNFYGFYTILLEKGDELISVATFRIYGKQVAEMPLVATSFQYRRQGMCRLLINELEKMLSALGIEKLILPGIPQLVETWTTSFGFRKMTHLERSNLFEFTFLNFQNTTMCQKILMKTKGPRRQPRKHRDGSRNNDIDCYGCNIFSEVTKTADPIQIRASDEVQTYSLHSQKVAVGDSDLANASNSPSSVYYGLETKHIEQSGITDGISRDIAAGEGDRGCDPISCLDAAGKESDDQNFNERSSDGIGYNSFKYFYTRRRISVSKNPLAQPLGVF